MAIHLWSTMMDALDKIVYVADKVEVSRTGIPPELRDLAFQGDDLDEIFLEVFRETVGSLRSGKRKLSLQTLALWEHLKGPTGETGKESPGGGISEPEISGGRR